MSNGHTSPALGYARAVYELALESWHKDLSGVTAQLAGNPTLLAQLNDTRASFEARQKQLAPLLPAGASAQVRNFFYTLLKDGNLHLLAEITANLQRLAARGPAMQVAAVTTAVALSTAEQEQFKTKLAAKYGNGLDLEFKVDPAIIGGVVVQVGDKILDGSVSAKLNAARESLISG
ncbi:MAG: ATP synthase F1 subunit delta [Anaerolineae bacterium]